MKNSDFDKRPERIKGTVIGAGIGIIIGAFVANPGVGMILGAAIGSALGPLLVRIFK